MALGKRSVSNRRRVRTRNSRKKLIGGSGWVPVKHTGGGCRRPQVTTPKRRGGGCRRPKVSRKSRKSRKSIKSIKSIKSRKSRKSRK